MIAYQTSTCACVFHASVATRSPALNTEACAAPPTPSGCVDRARRSRCDRRGRPRAPSRLRRADTTWRRAPGTCRASARYGCISPSIICMSASARQRWRGEPDVPVPRNAALRATAANDLLVELVHAGQQMRLRTRRIFEGHVGALGSVRGPRRLTRSRSARRCAQTWPSSSTIASVSCVSTGVAGTFGQLGGVLSAVPKTYGSSLA